MSKKLEKPNLLKTTRKERRKKLAKFQDTAHRCFGKPFSQGIGEGKSNYCPTCQEKCSRAYWKEGKWYCKICDSETISKEKYYGES